MKITFVCPRAVDIEYPPLGVLYIAAVLEKEGHSVQILDPFPNTYDFLTEIEAFKPQLVAFSIMTTDLLRARTLIERIKKRFPKAKYAAGGAHVTAQPGESLKYLNLDFVVVGEGEITMKEACQCLENNGSLQGVKGIIYREADKIFANEQREFIRDLDDLPYPARHLIDFNKYLLPPGLIRSFYLKRSTTMITSRGCPYHCIYCSSHLIFGRKIRRRSVDNVIREIEHLIREYRIDGLYFVDDTFTLDHPWVYKFCRELKDRNINLVWACQARANTVSKNLLYEMRSAGCREIEFGVESGSSKVLKTLKKGTNPEMIIKAFALCREVGLKTTAFFMIGNPDETLKDIEETLKLAKQIKANRTKFYFITPFPGTELNSMSTTNRWHDPSVIYDEEWDFTEQPTMEINFSKQELIKIMTRLQNSFFWRDHLAKLRNVCLMSDLLIVLLRHPKELCYNLANLLRSRRINEFVKFSRRIYEKDKTEEYVTWKIKKWPK